MFPPYRRNYAADALPALISVPWVPSSLLTKKRVSLKIAVLDANAVFRPVRLEPSAKNELVSLLLNPPELYGPVSSGAYVVGSGEISLIDGNSDAVQGVDVNNRFACIHIRKGFPEGDSIVVCHHRTVLDDDFHALTILKPHFIKLFPGDVGP